MSNKQNKKTRKLIEYPKKDLVGNVYGRLTVVSFHGYTLDKSNKRLPYWLCKCECGNTKVINTYNLTKKNGTSSCGCLISEHVLRLNKNRIVTTKHHKEETKEKIRQSLLGRSPSNKGVKRNEPAWNKLPTKTVLCECCGIPFEVPITSNQKYYKGHYQIMMKSGGNPCSKQETKDKIRKTLLKTYEEHPEILENRKPSGINQFSEGYTSIEKPIADALNSMNIAFSHNRKVGRYFPDFLIFHNVIIECDGEYWHNEEKDSKRDSYLMDNGYYIFRLEGKRILKDPIGCVRGIVTILHHLDHRHALTYELKN